MYVFCMSVCFSAAAYLFFLFISFFCKGKNLPFESDTECGFKYFWGVVLTGKKWNHDVNFLFPFSFFFFLHSTPPACGQSTSPTVDQIPTTLQRIRPRQAHLVCSADATEVTQKAPPSSFFPPIDNFSLSLLLLSAWLDLIYETKCAFAGWLKQSFETSIKSHLMSYECRNLSTAPRLTFTTARIIIGAGKLTLTWWCQGWLWIFLFFFLSLWMHHDTHQSHLTSIAVSRTLEMLID